MPFSLRECKDRKKGRAITMVMINIFSVRLLAQLFTWKSHRWLLPYGDANRTLLGRTPSRVGVGAGQRALQGKQQKKDHESQANLCLQRVFD